MNLTIDVRNYVTRPRMNATNAIVLAHRVVQQAEGEEGGVTDPTQKKLLRAILKGSARVEDVQRERMRLRPEKLRPVMMPLANAFLALHGALESIGRLPVEASGRSKRAQRVLGLAFPEGVSFVNADAETAWVAASRSLAIIVEQDLGAEIEELIGPEFVRVARSAVDALGETLGVKGGKRLPSSAALADALEALSLEIARYGRYLVSQLDDEDPASCAKFLRAVAPIDAHRASMRGTGGEDPSPPEPSAPTDPAVTPQPEIDSPAVDPPSPVPS